MFVIQKKGTCLSTQEAESLQSSRGVRWRERQVRSSGWRCSFSEEEALTALLAEDKEELSSAVFHVGVDVRHEADDFVPQSVSHFWTVFDIAEGGQHLRAHAHTWECERACISCQSNGHSPWSAGTSWSRGGCGRSRSAGLETGGESPSACGPERTSMRRKTTLIIIINIIWIGL